MDHNTVTLDIMNASSFEGQEQALNSRRQQRRKRRQKVRSVILSCLVVFGIFDTLWSDETAIRRMLKTCEETYYKYSENEEWNVWNELYPSGTIDYYHDHRDDNKTVPASQDIAFVIPLLDCPDRPEGQKPGVPEDSPDNTVFYDHMSMLKFSICTECGQITVGDETYNATIYAMIAGDSLECVGPGGETFDRVKILEELGFYVIISGTPSEEDDIVGSSYLKSNVEHDVGIKDLTKLNIYNQTMYNHEIVILVDYSTFMLQPLDDLINNFRNSDAPAAFVWDDNPNPNVTDPLQRGVDTALLAIKPSVAIMNEIVHLYNNANYDPNLGWEASGVVNFPGQMGTSGLLAYYYRTFYMADPNKPDPILLDPCVYSNNVKPECENTNFDTIMVAKIDSKSPCGKPYDCVDNTNLPDTNLCIKYEERWFNRREEYENDSFHNEPKHEKNGKFKKERTKGYCKEGGRKGYEPILKLFDEVVVVEEDNSTSTVTQARGNVPNTKREQNTQSTTCSDDITCPDGQVVTTDCTCSEDPCDACPEGTYCSKSSNGNPPLCIDCNCGFCDYFGNSCCDFNGVNNCKAANNHRTCLLQVRSGTGTFLLQYITVSMTSIFYYSNNGLNAPLVYYSRFLPQNGYFPGWPGTGNSCSGVEISATAVPNGCGCQPNNLTPCTYDRTVQENKCFIVRANELLPNTESTDSYMKGLGMVRPTSPEALARANSCKDCLASCDSCIDAAAQEDVHAMQKCLGRTIGRRNEGEECRANCASVCRHGPSTTI